MNQTTFNDTIDNIVIW